mgnify:CR=1 FL=1
MHLAAYSNLWILSHGWALRLDADEVVRSPRSELISRGYSLASRFVIRDSEQGFASDLASRGVSAREGSQMNGFRWFSGKVD